MEKTVSAISLIGSAWLGKNSIDTASMVENKEGLAPVLVVWVVLKAMKPRAALSPALPLSLPLSRALSRLDLRTNYNQPSKP